MTGRIKTLSNETASGVIRTENGMSVPFDSAAILAYDATCLAVGQLVTFEVETGSRAKAFNICVQKSQAVASVPDKRVEIMRVRFAGFDQTDSIRTYRFELIANGEETKTFAVTADLSLFRKHRIGIQEGPALCLKVLLSELENLTPEEEVTHWALTDQNMLDHLASRPVPGKKPGPRRTARSSSMAPGMQVNHAL
jgi:cold shock CspA family protein